MLGELGYIAKESNDIFLTMVKGKTVICISHREAAMEACDNVVLLENGTI